jgi:Tfp pilus assembly protein PilV
MKKVWSTTRGFLLVEIILTSSLFIIFLTAFAGVFYYGLQSSSSSGDRGRAVILMDEGQEAVRSIRNMNFANLTDGTYGLTYSNNAWSLASSSDVSGIFTRQVTISTIDANRKNVTVTVNWQQTPTRAGTVSSTARFTNWKTVQNLGVGITVSKIVINHGLTKTASDFAPYKVGTTTVTLGTSTKFAPGTYTVTETTNSNYNQSFSGDCNASGQITVASGTAKLCTITNEEKLSYVTVNVSVINHGSSKVVADFAPFKVGSTTVTQGALTPIDSGAYMITGKTDSNYNQTFSGDCFTNGSITVTTGDNDVCTITYEEVITGSLSPSLSGLMIYGDGTNVPKFRTYNTTTNTFSAQTGTFTATVGPTWIIKTSPVQHLALAGYYDSSATLTIMCFDGTNWTKEFAAASGGVGNRHRFDIAYEKTTGNAMIVYSKGGNSGDTTRWGKLGYRTKTGGTGCGQGWSSEIILTPSRTTSDIMYVKMAQDKRAGSNLLALTWVDTNDDISARIWNGTAWANEPSTVTDTAVQIVSSSHDIEDMDIEYMSLSGNLMLIWGNSAGRDGTNGVRYRLCSNGTATCTWGSVTTPPTFLDDATSLDISANPNTDELVFASIGKGGGDLQAGYWNGTGWVNTANMDTTCTVPFTGSKLVTTGWLTNGTTTRSIIVYSDLNSGNINWYSGNANVFTRQPDFVPSPAIATSRGYMDIHLDPIDKSQLMYLTSDSNSDVFAKRLLLTSTSSYVWSNSDGGPIGTTLPQIISSPFSFAFWQK